MTQCPNTQQSLWIATQVSMQLKAAYAIQCNSHYTKQLNGTRTTQAAHLSQGNLIHMSELIIHVARHP